MHISAALASALTAAVLLLPAAVHAQEKKDPAVYRVEFNIRDTSAAATRPALRYTLRVESNHRAVFKTGSRVPVATSSYQPAPGGTEANPPVATQFTYVDVGVNIECLVNEADGRIAMHGSLDLSTVSDHDALPRAGHPANPTLGQTKLELDTVLDLAKPTVVAAIDDPSTSRHFQVEATVTRAD
jgi:hypothetical protein